MAAGAPGKVGTLELRFAADGDRTVLARSHSSGPLRVGRLLEGDPPSAMIQSVSGGVLQGDRLSIEVSVAEGARVRVVTQSAQRIYEMQANYATQHITVSVDAGGVLEYLPHPAVAHAGARFHQEIEVEVARGGLAIITDGWCAGRVERGERFAYGMLSGRLTVRSAGRVLALDSWRNEPLAIDPCAPGVLGGADAWGSVWVIAPGRDAGAIAGALWEMLDAGRVHGGASPLPSGDGAAARITAGGYEALSAALEWLARAGERATGG